MKAQNPWNDAMVKQALKEGRCPTDIALLLCPCCDGYSYYNEGSSFTCGWCDSYYHGFILDQMLEEVIQLSDYDEDEGVVP